jgi:tellurite resistance protein TerC
VDKLWELAGFHILIFALLAIDLGIFHRKAHEIRAREAIVWSFVWIGLAALFCGWVDWALGRQRAIEFATAYIVEKSLSVDNIFVFVVIFTTFAVPPLARHRVLYWGVLGAILLRGPLIYLGNGALRTLHVLIYVLGSLLILTGVRLVLEREDDEKPEAVNDWRIVRLVRHLVPTTDGYRGARLFVREAGRVLATPLFATLLIVEISDVMFAIDSIPAVLAISDDFFVMYTSNIFAILGLRALFFLVSAGIEGFRYLKPALAFILVFVGAKMILGARDIVKIDPATSLAVIVVALLVAAFASAHANRKERRAAEAAAAASPPIDEKPPELVQKDEAEKIGG